MLRMKSIGIWSAVVCIALAASLSCHSAAEPESDAAAVERAQAAAQQFKQDLKAALMAGLAKGPAEAIDACRVEAPGIAVSIDREDLHIGRTSHRLRNPANAPKPWMQPLLESLREATPGEASYQTVRIDSQWLGYAEPIFVQPMCLTCHGSDLAPAVRERLQASYPEDQATGFAVGDFRGLFWVEVRGEARGG